MKSTERSLFVVNVLKKNAFDCLRVIFDAVNHNAGVGGNNISSLYIFICINIYILHIIYIIYFLIAI